MKLRVFLDTNIFIYAYEFHESNSNKTIDLLNKGQIEAVISERVLKEVMMPTVKEKLLKEIEDLPADAQEKICSAYYKGRDY